MTGRIKGRGNTTWGMPKKPWRIKLDEKTHAFSRWGNKDWILLANYSDKTLLRNIMAMEISRICTKIRKLSADTTFRYFLLSL